MFIQYHFTKRLIVKKSLPIAQSKWNENSDNPKEEEGKKLEIQSDTGEETHVLWRMGRERGYRKNIP